MFTTTITTRLGEIITSWTSHKHPDNPEFMQVVKYMHIQYPDGRNNLIWRLFNSAPNDRHIIGNISLADAQRLYTDVEETAVDITEEQYQLWLSQRNK